VAINNEILYAHVDELYLDQKNPRLGRAKTAANLTQPEILEVMKGWTLDELAISFLESGFWVAEALMVVKETVDGEDDKFVVVEGNRRLAALKYLQKVRNGDAPSRKWENIAEGTEISDELLEEVPYVMVDERKDIQAFLGFRHVTGIKEWRPAEKAQYIARLIEDESMSYVDVMRKIGSHTPTVRQHYISYRLLLQMEGEEDISVEHVEDKFSVLYLSLRTEGVQKYLDINIMADPSIAHKPVPDEKLKKLSNFALWLFGDEKRAPVVRDSRLVDKFGVVLQSEEAVEYLERTDDPKFEVAYRTAGGDEPEIIKMIEQAADNVELALSRAHLYKESEKLQKAVDRLYKGVKQISTTVSMVTEESSEGAE
jgi:ParB-like chromosome segregation protein Spo0J